MFELRAIYKKLFMELISNPEIFNLNKPIEKDMVEEKLPWFSDMTSYKVAGNLDYVKKLVDKGIITL